MADDQEGRGHHLAKTHHGSLGKLHVVILRVCWTSDFRSGQQWNPVLDLNNNNKYAGDLGLGR